MTKTTELRDQPPSPGESIALFNNRKGSTLTATSTRTSGTTTTKKKKKASHHSKKHTTTTVARSNNKNSSNSSVTSVSVGLGGGGASVGGASVSGGASVGSTANKKRNAGNKSTTKKKNNRPRPVTPTPAARVKDGQELITNIGYDGVALAQDDDETFDISICGKDSIDYILESDNESITIRGQASIKEALEENRDETESSNVRGKFSKSSSSRRNNISTNVSKRSIGHKEQGRKGTKTQNHFVSQNESINSTIFSDSSTIATDTLASLTDNNNLTQEEVLRQRKQSFQSEAGYSSSNNNKKKEHKLLSWMKKGNKNKKDSPSTASPEMLEAEEENRLICDMDKIRNKIKKNVTQRQTFNGECSTSHSTDGSDDRTNATFDTCGGIVTLKGGVAIMEAELQGDETESVIHQQEKLSRLQQQKR